METIRNTKKNGQESFSGLNRTLLDYWSWAHSDVASNAERGVLAEYLVHCAVSSETDYRTEWDTYDVLTKEGIKIEVKTSAYLQTWQQNRFSRIQFDIAPKTSGAGAEKRRPADVYVDVYVFCLFANKDASTANPMEVEQWEFYVLGADVLNEKVPDQKSIGLEPLLKLGARKVQYCEIYEAVKTAR